jgi:hypothetical protein
MSTRTSLPVTGLASVRNARTRIFPPGADPKFRANPTGKTFRFVRAFPEAPGAAADLPDSPWRRDLLDRLQTPISRRRE